MMGKVITTVAHPGEGSMSTLYGNDVAIKDARAGKAYSAGAVVTLVTWEQRDDPHWFGGRIPAAVRSVEVIKYGEASDTYSAYNGAGVEIKNNSGLERERYIVGLKAAVLP
jgi:hypothetical protein